MLEINKLYNTKDKSKILIVVALTKSYAMGYNMLYEVFVKVPIVDLELSNVNILKFISGKNKTAIALIIEYFNNNNNVPITEMCEIIGMSERTIYRYLSNLNIN